MDKGDVIFEYIGSKSQLADFFAKLLSLDRFPNICRDLEVLDSSCLKYNEDFDYFH